jgi:hypothetical protein
MSDKIIIGLDKDNIGTVVFIKTSDGKLLQRKGEESLDFEYLKDFVGCEVEIVLCCDGYSIDVKATEEHNSGRKKLTSVTKDEVTSKTVGKTVYMLNIDDKEKDTVKLQRV